MFGTLHGFLLLPVVLSFIGPLIADDKINYLSGIDEKKEVPKNEID